MIPAARIALLVDAPLRSGGDFVLYWMIASRRPTSSFALERARDLARESGRPLVVLEALWLDYPHASPRLHAFVLEGMADNARAFAERGAAYHPYVERAAGDAGAPGAMLHCGSIAPRSAGCRNRCPPRR